jgi:hypothetical protein
MDPKEYDRIADLLMQIRKKYDNTAFQDQMLKRSVLEHIDALLSMNDECGQLAGNGWL